MVRRTKSSEWYEEQPVAGGGESDGPSAEKLPSLTMVW